PAPCNFTDVAAATSFDPAPPPHDEPASAIPAHSINVTHARTLIANSFGVAAARMTGQAPGPGVECWTAAVTRPRPAWNGGATLVYSVLTAGRYDPALPDYEKDSAMPNTADAASLEAALQRRLQRLGLSGDDDAWTDRYLVCENFVDRQTARDRQRFEAISRFIRDLVAHRWVKTRIAREQANPKRVYYLSMEFLLGRMLNNNIINVAADPIVRRGLEREGWDREDIFDQEPDAGLGNGGLGRLAACFIDSLATME